MTGGPIVATLVTAGAWVVGAEVNTGAEGYVGDVVSIGGLAAVVAFLFRWGQTEIAKARSEGAQATTDLREEHKREIADLKAANATEIAALKAECVRELDDMRAERDTWQSRYLAAIEPTT